MKSEKKIKIEDLVLPLEEQPYEIPDNWVWTRLKNVSEIFTGNSISENIKKDNYTDLNIGYNYIATKDISFDSHINYKNGIKIPYHEKKFRVAKRNSSLICIEGGSAGRKIGFLEEDVCFVNKLCCIDFFKSEKKIMFYFLNTSFFSELFKNNMNGLIGGVSLNKIKELAFPLPPLEEQKRIVEKLDYFSEKINRLKALIEEVKADIENRKISILDKAFKGELTTKWREKNSCSDILELLENINKEKIAKWEDECAEAEKNGNKKPKKPTLKSVDEMIVSEDESPYKIPDTWICTRLEEIGEYKKGPFGSDLKKSLFIPYSQSAIKVYEQKNAIKKDATLGSYYISEKYFFEKLKNFEVLEGDIIMSCAGTIGETFIIPKNIKKGIINQALMRIRISKFVEKDFFLLAFNFLLKKISKDSSKGTAIVNIPPFDIFKKLTFPLPPLEEQKEIVRILDEVLERENKISEILKMEEQINLLEKSILNKAFRGELGTGNMNDVPALEMLKEKL